MRDQDLNTFQGGMFGDAGKTIPQNNTYNYAENIRIVSDGSGKGETGVVVNVDGNTQKISFAEVFEIGITPPDLYLEAFNGTYSDTYFAYNPLTYIEDLDSLGEYQEVPLGLSYVLHGDILMRLVDCETGFRIPWTDQELFYQWLENNSLRCEQMEQDHIPVEDSPFSPQGLCECRGVEYITGVDIPSYPEEYQFIPHTAEEYELRVDNIKVLGYTDIRDTIIFFLRYIRRNDFNSVNMGTIIAYDALKNNGEYDIIYSGVDLFSEEADSVEAVARYESEDIQRVYWTDNFSSLKTLNIADPNLQNKTVIDLEFAPIVKYSTISVERSTEQGSLPAGMYQYCYRLSKKDGTQTRFSPISNFAHVLDGTSYWNYNEDPENTSEYSDTPVGQETNKSLLVKVKNDFSGNAIDSSFDFIEIAAIYSNGLNSISDCILLNKDYIPSQGTSYTKLHKSMGEGAPILLEELTAINTVPSRAKTIEEKDNRLFLGNISYAESSLEFNAQAFRYARNDNKKFPVNPVDNESQVFTYVSDPDFRGIRKSDDINPHNESRAVSSYLVEQEYKFKKDGVTLGGEGPYVSYEFTKKPLQGNAGGWSFPDSAPLLEGVLQSNPDCGESSAGFPDYKSVYTVSNFKGYQRDEVYRFGIVLYDLQGNPGFVNWIGDIKFPEHHAFDHKKRGGIYNYTLAQNYATYSGCNINIQNEDNNAYLYMWDHSDVHDYGYDWGDNEQSIFDTVADDKGYDEVLSTFSYKIDAPAYLGGNLYALGIEFTVTIPAELRDKVGGYSIVRVEREQEDKTILGSGIVNFLQTAIHVSPPGLGETQSTSKINCYFEEKLQYKRGSNYSAGDNERHYNNIFTIDSPDFAFDQTYPAGDCLFVKVVGALNGRTTEDCKAIDTANVAHVASIFTSHSLARNSAYLGRVYNVAYSSKFERGAHIPASAVDSKIMNELVINDFEGVWGAVNFTDHEGFYNQSWLNAQNDINSVHKSLTGVGEESLFVITEPTANDVIPGGFQGEIQFYRFVKEGVNETKKSKLLAQVKRTLTGQYGGNTFVDRSKNTYISTGNIVRDISKENVEVWGGDTYVTMYDLTKIKAANSSDGDVDHSGSPTSAHFAFPVESTMNTTLRGGYHFGNKTDFSGLQEQQFNTFELRAIYSQENKTSVFIPRPLNFIDTSLKDTTIVYSQPKIDTETVDSWKQFKIDNLRRLDGAHGNLEKLIVNNDIMYFLQKTGFGKLVINPVSTVLDQSGSSIVLGTGDVIQDTQYLSNHVGNQDKRNVVATPKGLYWVDQKANKIYAFRANGLESISDTHGIKSVIYTLLVANANDEVKVNIASGYDFLNSEVLFSVYYTPTQESIDLIGEQSVLSRMPKGNTIVFNESINKFTSIYTFESYLIVNDNKHIFSISPNHNVYEHNVRSYKWYSKPFHSLIEFIVNKNPTFSKVFDSMQWYSEGGGDGEDLITDAEFSTSENSSTLVVFDDENNNNYFPYKQVKEKITRLPIPRTNAGYRFRDTYLKVKLMSHNTSKVVLHYVKTLFRISRR